MPFLKDLHCFVELYNGTGKGDVQLREFGTTYGDGSVETYIAVPGHQHLFAIRLRSNDFIAQGLAMYVFIDGVYQCNRNRQGLRLRKPLDRKSLVDFVVRQKEDRYDDGSMTSRDWSFGKLDDEPTDEAPGDGPAKKFKHLGRIEVFVLRCSGFRNENTPDTKPMPINLDGAGDSPDHHFGLDGGYYPDSPSLDDRPWDNVRRGSTYNAPRHAPSLANSGPPPPLPSLSLGGGRYYDVPESPPAAPPAAPVSRLQGLLSGPNIFRYGSGPIQRQPQVPAPSNSGARNSNLPFDPRSLDSKLMKIVDQGSAKYHPAPQAQPSPFMMPNAPSSNLPGSWPGQFGGGDSPLVSPVQNMTLGSIPPPMNDLAPQSPLQNTHISWRDDLPKPSQGWNDNNGWESGGEDKNEDSWGNSSSWSTAEESSTYIESQATDGWNSTPRTYRNIGAARPSRVGLSSLSSDFRTARSRPTESAWEPKEVGDEWTHIDTVSDMTEAWVMTQSVHPSESVSHLVAPSAATHHTSNDPLAQMLTAKSQTEKYDKVRFPFDKIPDPRTWPMPQPPFKPPFFENGFSTAEQYLHSLPSKKVVPPKWPTDDSKSKMTVGSRTSVSKQTSKTRPEWATDSSKNVVTAKQSKPSSEAWYKHTRELSNDNGWPKEQKRSSGHKHSKSRTSKTNAVDSWAKEKPSQETANKATWGTPTKPQDDSVSSVVDSWQTEMNGWATTQKPTSVVNEPNPWESDKSYKHQPSKGRPSQRDQRQAPASEANSKAGWSLPPPLPAQKRKSKSEKAASKVEPIVKVSKDVAAKKGIHNQVHLGESVKYGHAIGRPEYIDNLEKPYAVFRFNYRSHAALGKLLGKDVVPADPKLLVVSPADTLPLAKAAEDPKQVKQQLESVSKDKLIDGLLDLQKKLEKMKEGKEGKDVHKDGMDSTKDWVKRQSGGNGAKKGKGEGGKGSKDKASKDKWGKGMESKDTGGKKDKDNGWGGAGEDGGGWGESSGW